MSTATAVRKRLLSPVNGRHSDETEIVPQRIWLQEQEKKVDRSYRRKLDKEVRQAKVAAQVQFKRDVETVRQLCGTGAKEILIAVSEYYRIPLAEMLAARRDQFSVTARFVAMYLARKHTMRSYPQIGRIMGNRDHTTVLHAIWKVESRIQNEPQLVADIEAIRVKLGLVPARVSDQPENAGRGD